jgi:hypothetical protein
MDNPFRIERTDDIVTEIRALERLARLNEITMLSTGCENPKNRPNSFKLIHICIARKGFYHYLNSVHIAAEIAPFATIGSFLIAILIFLDRFFPEHRAKLIAKFPQLLKWKWSAVFAVIGCASAIFWGTTRPTESVGQLMPRIVDLNLVQMIKLSPTQHVFMFLMEVYNKGRPTVTCNWVLRINSRINRDTNTTVVAFNQRDLASLLPANDSRTNAFRGENYIFEKTRRTPIPTGGMENGFMEFLVPDVGDKLLNDSTTTYDVIFDDVYGYSYTNTFQFPAPKQDQ